MPFDLLIAITAGLGGMIGWGLADLFAKKTIDEIGDITSLVLAHIFGSIVLAFVVLFRIIVDGNVPIPAEPATWGLLVLFGILQALVYLLVYIGFGKGQVTILNPIFASFSGLTALASIVILGEIVTGNLPFALGTIFLGILLINVDPEALTNRRLSFSRVPGFGEIAAATVLAAIWTLGWDAFLSAGQDWLSAALFMYLFMTIALLIYAGVRRVSLSVSQPGMWKYLILIGVFEILAYVAISWGYGATPHTSVVALLSGAFSLPTILLARVWLKERTTKLQAAASIVIVAGIMLLSVPWQ